MRVPKVTSILLVVLTTLTLLNFVLKYYLYFVLVVSSSKSTTEGINEIAQETGEVPHPHELFVPLLTFIPTRSPVLTRPWVLVTSSFIEENFVGATASFMLFFYFGKYLENIWGAAEFLKFIGTIVVCSNAAIYLYYTIKKMLYWGSDFPVPPVIISAAAIDMGLFVAIKQRISNHYFIFFKGNLRLKITYLPFILLAATFVLQALSEEFYAPFVLSALGFLISWTYLRFFKIGANERQSYLLPFALNRKRSNKLKYKVKPATVETVGSSAASTASLHLDSTPLRGDRSVQFSLHTFFPYPLSTVVRVLSSMVFNTLTHYKLLNSKDWPEFDDDEDDGQLMFEDVNNLLTNLFSLSSLKGASGEVSAIPNASSKLRSVWEWAVSKGTKSSVGSIKSSMDKRRKLALKELE